MARPQKDTVDYFPHYCIHKKTMYIVEQKFGNDGYSFWFKLLELLGATRGHYLDMNDLTAWEFLQARTNLQDFQCTGILDLLANLEAIDRELWTERKMVYSQNFVDGITDVYRKRKQKLPARPVFDDGKLPFTDVSASETPQSKVNENKQNKPGAHESAPAINNSENPEKDELVNNIEKLQAILKAQGVNGSFNLNNFILRCSKKGIAPPIVNYVVKELAARAPDIKNFWAYSATILDRALQDQAGQESLERHLKLKAFELDFANKALKTIHFEITEGGKL